jgi:hypothetical protein
MTLFLRALTSGALAALLVLATLTAGARPWLAFVPWTTYLVLAGTPREGLRVHALYLTGLGLGAGIAAVSARLPAPVPHGGEALAVLAVALGLGLLERTRGLSEIGAYYLGMSSWFALGGVPSEGLLRGVALPTSIGLLVGIADKRLRDAIAARARRAPR